jgi:thiaminase
MMHIQTEVKLHLTLCKEYGVSDEEMERGEEDLACVAYTRWVGDVGNREDWFGLQVAMMPCLFGYGVIGQRLFDDANTKRGINPSFCYLLLWGSFYFRLY